MRPTIWTPSQGYPDGARARDYLREQRRREQDRWRRIQDPRLPIQPWQAAIAYGTTGFKTGTAAGSGAVTEPASAASGDVFVALCLVDAVATSLLRPTGWTNILNDTTGAGGMDFDISWVARGGSAPNLSWTWTGSWYYEVHILRFTGVDNVSPIDAQGTLVKSTSGNKGNSQAGSDVDPPAVIAATTNTMAIAIAGHWTGSSSAWSAPTNYTMRSTNTAGLDGMMATRLLTGTGSEDPNEFFESTNTALNHLFAMTITLKEASAGTTLTPAQGALSLAGLGTSMGFGILMPDEV
jgi:hypothetical protein